MNARRSKPDEGFTLIEMIVTVSLLAVVGLAVFGALFVQVAYNPPIWAMLIVALPMVAGLSLGLMRPGKGVMIALQMRNRSGQSRHDG